MKKLATAMALTAVITAPVFAANHHQHGSVMKGGQMQEGEMQEGEMQGGMMGMMNHKQMHEHMQSMQKIMADIKQEKDPEKRHQLMRKHMQSMKKGMQMMNECMGMKKNMKVADHQGKGMPEKMGDMDMKKRMGMMEERMNMMQMMMGQMMDHESESKKAPVHEHKK